MTFDLGNTDNLSANKTTSGQGSGFSWGEAARSALPLPLSAGLSLGGGFASGLMHPTQHQGPSGDQKPEEAGKEKDKNKQGAPEAKEHVEKTQAKEDPPPSRAELLADPEKYGMPKGMSKEQYATQYASEYLAKLSYKDPHADANDKKAAAPGYSKADQEFLKGWGYKFPPTEVKDQSSGLYVAKFDPQDPKAGINPVVAFRGTEGGSPDKRETLKDVKSDAAFSYIGQDQYESKKAEIAALFKDKNGMKVDVTGHSLGGALAQKAVVDNIAQTHALTTFQAPGILKADADKFAQENKQYGVDVNHHYVNTDLVHRAGEAKLAGNFWEHTIPGKDGKPLKGPDQLGELKLPNSIADLKKDVGLLGEIGGNVGASHTNHELMSNKLPPPTLHTTDPNSDRAMWEGLRKGAGQRLNSTHLFDAIEHGLDAKQHLNNIGGEWQKGKEAGNQAWSQGKAGAKDGMSEAGHGFSDLAHLHVTQGLSEIGHGVGSGLGNLVHGGLGWAQGRFDGAKGAGSELLHAGQDVRQAGSDLHNGWGGIKGLVQEGIGFVKSHPAIMNSAKAVAADGIKQLEKGPAGPVIQGAKDTYSHGHDAVDHAVAAGSAVKGGFQGAAQSVSSGVSGAVQGGQQAGHGLSELGHLQVRQGLSDIGHGVSGGVSSAVHGAGGAVSSLWQGARGAVHEAGSALSDAKSAGKSLLSTVGGAGHLISGLFGHHSQ